MVLVKTYKGYINYYIKSDIEQKLKTHVFERKTRSEVEKLITQFQNEEKYKYKGMVKVRDKDQEREISTSNLK